MSVNVTSEHVKDGLYIGPSLANVEGDITVATNLGWFTVEGPIAATGNICIERGTGIKAGEGIAAGLGITAGWSITAGWGITAGEGIAAGLGITAGWGITAGEDITAGLGIEAGWGIKAGFSISAKFVVARLRIFVGLCPWRLPKPEECELRAELRGGTLAFGTHVPPAPVNA